MKKQFSTPRPKRKPFFLKGNFQLLFIVGFVFLLLLEVLGAGIFIYRLSAAALEDAAFRSHLGIYRTAEILKPIVLKVNIYALLVSLIAGVLAVIIAYFRFHAVFAKIMEGLEHLRNNNTSFRLKPRGSKNTRELMNDFNQAASHFDRQLNAVNTTLDILREAKDIKKIIPLHDKLYSLITGKTNP